MKINEYLKKPFSLLLMLAILCSAAFCLVFLFFIVGYILFRGIPHLSPGLFALKYTAKNVSMLPAIINTVYMTLISLLISVPTGVFSAVYLAEYAKRGSPLVKLIRITAETLSGIPSIVYGLFGFLAFVTTLGWGYSLISGAITLAIMVLPTVIRTAEEALIAVPDSFREGSFGLGAGRLRTVFKVVIPSAMPGIISGIILAAGRITGETAALIFTAGTVASIPKSIFDSARTLSVHMYCLLSEGLHTDEAYATAVVLLLAVIGINTLSGFLAKKIGGENEI